MIRPVILFGLAKSGKSTFSTLVQEEAERQGIACKEFSIVDYPKLLLELITGGYDKTPKARVFIHELKMALEKYSGACMNYMLDKIKLFIKDKNNVILFINMREDVDIEAFTKKAIKNGWNKPLLVLVKRAGITKETTDEVPELIDEILNKQYDIVINNDGTLEDLKQKAVHFILEEV